MNWISHTLVNGTTVETVLVFICHWASVNSHLSLPALTNWYNARQAILNLELVTKMSRREQLEEMLAETPDDTFLRYALAMELETEDENERSLELHQGLIDSDPPYVPSFFMSGQQLANLDRIEEAKTMLQKGIEQADLQNNTHAAGEMRQFLDSLD